MTPRKKPKYTPAQTMLDAITALEEAERVVSEKRKMAYQAVADELRDTGLSAETIAGALPWTPETVRSIGKSHGVPMLRKPTVRSIKE